MKRIRKIVSGLQHLSRDTEHDEYHDSCLSELIRDALSVCESRFSQKGVRLQVSLLEDDPLIRCNAGQICQILINLLNNAFDATEHLDNPWVQIRAIDNGSTISIRVTDSGPGIPSEMLSRIFDPFFTTKAPGKGTGLGLSISKNLIARHGGRIHVDQDSPHTCFMLDLGKDPAHSQDAA